ncbi:YchJ family protein [Shewanella putrefaciens]|nr:YchJ family protein [Shewanella putrefaciens]MDR6964464.1 SEC-C motif-containing protein [Shewanella putrefaciens]
MSPEYICPCGTGKYYRDCCEPLHLDSTFAHRVEQLMRSRYSAFALKKFDYIIKTQHPDFLGDLTLANLNLGPHPHWLGLDLIASEEFVNSTALKQGTVTFKAWYKLEGEIDAIYEHSEFIYQDNRWYYTKGKQMTAKLPSRNDPCICHSGKKFKQCCLNSL